MPYKYKESEETQRLRKELSTTFNQKLDNLRCHFERKITTLEAELRDLKEENTQLRSIGSKRSVSETSIHEVQQSVEFLGRDTHDFKEDITRKIDSCVERQSSLVESVEKLNEKLAELTEAIS